MDRIPELISPWRGPFTVLTVLHRQAHCPATQGLYRVPAAERHHGLLYAWRVYSRSHVLVNESSHPGRRYHTAVGTMNAQRPGVRVSIGNVVVGVAEEAAGLERMNAHLAIKIADKWRIFTSSHTRNGKSKRTN